MKRRFASQIVMMFLLATGLIAAPCGQLVVVTVHSKALEGNHVYDSPDREVAVYLPPDYASGERHYPVIYLLHGYTGTDRGWTNPSYADLPATMDRLLAHHAIEPMIVVMPNSFNRFGGSWYTNSALSGGCEDFIVRDVVDYVDAHYRTIPVARSRGIAGHSMGGYGALRLALRHPDVFTAVYGMSACCARWSDSFVPDAQTMRKLRVAKTLADVVADGGEAQIDLSWAAAFSPDPNNPPLGVDWPLDANNRPVPEVVAKWKAQMLSTILERYGAGEEGLRAIAFDVGKQDETREVLSGSRALDADMRRLGIPHIYAEYEGAHSDRVAERMQKFVLPFMSKALAAQTSNHIAKAAGF
jgi:S-formylglutathione hydrolase